VTPLTPLPLQFSEQGNPKEDAAQTLSNLSQAAFPPQQLPVTQQLPHHYMPNVSDPGPSSHPRGPPNLGQLSAVAASGAAQGQPPMSDDLDDLPSDGEGSTGKASGLPPASATSSPTGRNGATRSRGRASTMGSDEWTRQRKDNHVRRLPL
jgi:hypothetical protein